MREYGTLENLLSFMENLLEMHPTFIEPVYKLIVRMRKETKALKVDLVLLEIAKNWPREYLHTFWAVVLRLPEDLYIKWQPLSAYDIVYLDRAWLQGDGLTDAEIDLIIQARESWKPPKRQKKSM